QGTVMAWAGNDKVGEGKMTLIESKPNEALKIKVDFVKPFEGTANSSFTFKPDGNQTPVTWSMGRSSQLHREGLLPGDERQGDDRRRPREGFCPAQDRGRVR